MRAKVRLLDHNGMLRIVVTPNWAKLIDVETTLPSASRSSSGSEMSVSAPERRAVARHGVAYRVQLQALQRGVCGEGPARQGDASA
jgi:hypothetical protein